MPVKTDSEVQNGDVNKRKKQKRRGGCCGDCFFPQKREKTDDLENSVNQEYDSMVNKNAKISQPRQSFCLDLPDDLDPGTCFTIFAKILPECTRFSVNLTTGKDSSSDIAFHLNPRLAQRYIVRNSRLAGHWGKEETTSISKFNISRNTEIEIRIVLTETDFLVSINGKHVCGYVYRIPTKHIKRLVVDGPVDVTNASITKVNSYPIINDLNRPYIVRTGDEKDQTPKKLDVPLTAHLPEGFKQGWQLEIRGQIKILPDSFFVNLQDGGQLWPHPVIPLHLNPRFSGAHGNHIFVRNSWNAGSWDQEERTSGFQFIPGSSFSLAIRKQADFFAVFVDGKLVGEFRYRTPVDRIDTVYIQGDIVLTGIYLKDHIDDRYFTKKSLVKSL